MRVKKALLLLLLLAAVVAFLALGGLEALSIERLQARRDLLLELRAAHPWAFPLVFFAAYALMAALSLPGAAVMTVAAGALFGLALGTLLVSFASSIGATLAMLISRYLLRGWARAKLGRRLQRIDEGLAREGAAYLFALRLVPLFPYWAVNLAMGVTGIRVWTFYWVSQVGMLAATLVFVNAGTQLAELQSARGLLSPSLWLSFALVGIFPLLAKKLVEAVKARRALRRWEAPADADYNVVVIGAGAGGLVTAYIASAVNAQVALIEKERMGGDCLNTGCVPSKALLRSAKVLHDARRAEAFGFQRVEVDFDFADVMERVQRVIREIAPHDSVERYAELGVDCRLGAARVLDPYRVQVGDEVLTTRSIVIATGARPLVPPIEGVEDAAPLTSETLWDLRELPRRLAVVGGGPIGCELAQAFARFGSEVTVLEMAPRILVKEDADVSDLLARRLEAEGVRLLTGRKVVRFARRDGAQVVTAEDGAGRQVEVECDRVLLALGRAPNVTGFGLEALGVQLAERGGTVSVDPFLRTNVPTIYAVGDVAGPYQLTHFAAHQAWYAAVNALFSPFKGYQADYRVIPWTTFTDPEVARVGLNEDQAREQGVEHRVVRYDLAGLDRAITEGEAYGMVKVLTPPDSDEVLGATIVGPHAGEALAEYVAAMKHGLGLNDILGTIHAYPTVAEANKYAAGEWKKATKPERALRWLRRYHGWRRSRRKTRLLYAGLALAALLALAPLLAAGWYLSGAAG